MAEHAGNLRQTGIGQDAGAGYHGAGRFARFRTVVVGKN
jgi:hypothetical protein